MDQIDETMSQDQAFTNEDVNNETFTFDDVEDEKSNEQSQDNESDTVEEEEGSDDSTSPVGIEEKEQKVPYNRFKKVLDEKNETASKIQQLEERLSQFESNRQESKPEEVEMPAEWIELYGDGEVAKRAWTVQLKRETDMQERAINLAIDRMRSQQSEEVKAIEENEQLIDSSLTELQSNLGKKFTQKQEEELLTIVDEFSPVGADGKYISLFPFDKAYEIYTLRQGVKTQGTVRARQTVADLSNNTSEGEADSTSAHYKNGWDDWKEVL